MNTELQCMQETCNDRKEIQRTPSAITCIECGKPLRKVMNTKLQQMQENISFEVILQNIMVVTCIECGKPLRKVMSMKLQWMKETFF